MNTNSKKTTVFGTVIVAAALLASVGAVNAGGSTHRLPNDHGKTFPAYEIGIVTMPTSGHMLTVRLVNKHTGQLVTNAHVGMEHSVWKGIKAVPQIQMNLVGLEPDGRGDYICTREHVGKGERIVIRAHVPGEPSGTWTTLTLDS